jgi:hypothetical protein
MPKKPNPFTAPLTDSYEYDRAKETTVPEDELRRAESMIRRAAADLDIGVSIVADEPEVMVDDEGDPLKDSEGNVLRTVRIVFRGKERRARKKKHESPEGHTTPADGPEPPAEDTADDREPAAVGTSAA